MSTYLEIGLFLLGLAFGSFLNVVTLRYSPEEGFYHKKHYSGRSRCLYCQRNLSWYEMIPLFSYLFLKGKCHSCQSKLTVQYPLVELVSGLIFVFVPIILRGLFLSLSPNVLVLIATSSIIWITAFMFMLAMLVIDWRHYVIPNSVSLTLFIVALIWIVVGQYNGAFSSIYGSSFLKQFAAIFPQFSFQILNHLTGALLGLLFFLAIFVFSKGRAMGMGDVKLMGVLGLLFGWPDILVVMLLSFIIGALTSVFLMLRGKKKITDKIPFGPFIVISAAIVFFFGAGLMSAYFGIIGA